MHSGTTGADLGVGAGRPHFPIPGTKHIKYPEENVCALEVSLTKEELHKIDAIAPKGIAAGARYSANMPLSVNR